MVVVSNINKLEHIKHKRTGAVRTVSFINSVYIVHNPEHLRAAINCIEQLGYTVQDWRDLFKFDDKLINTAYPYTLITYSYGLAHVSPSVSELGIREFKQPKRLRQLYNMHFEGAQSQDNLAVLTVEKRATIWGQREAIPDNLEGLLPLPVRDYCPKPINGVVNSVVDWAKSVIEWFKKRNHALTPFYNRHHIVFDNHKYDAVDSTLASMVDALVVVLFVVVFMPLVVGA